MSTAGSQSMPITVPSHLKLLSNRCLLIVISREGLDETDCMETFAFYADVNRVEISPDRRMAIVYFECEHAPLLVAKLFKYYMDGEKVMLTDFATGAKYNGLRMPKGVECILPACSFDQFIYLQHVPHRLSNDDIRRHISFEMRQKWQMPVDLVIHRPISRPNASSSNQTSSRVVVELPVGMPASSFVDGEMRLCETVVWGEKLAFYAVPYIRQLTNIETIFDGDGCENCHVSTYRCMHDYVVEETAKRQRRAAEEQQRLLQVQQQQQVTSLQPVQQVAAKAIPFNTIDNATEARRWGIKAEKPKEPVAPAAATVATSARPPQNNSNPDPFGTPPPFNPYPAFVGGEERWDDVPPVTTTLTTPRPKDPPGPKQLAGRRIEFDVPLISPQEELNVYDWKDYVPVEEGVFGNHIIPTRGAYNAAPSRLAPSPATPASKPSLASIPHAAPADGVQRHDWRGFVPGKASPFVTVPSRGAYSGVAPPRPASPKQRPAQPSFPQPALVAEQKQQQQGDWREYVPPKTAVFAAVPSRGAYSGGGGAPPRPASPPQSSIPALFYSFPARPQMPARPAPTPPQPTRAPIMAEQILQQHYRTQDPAPARLPEQGPAVAVLVVELDADGYAPLVEDDGRRRKQRRGERALEKQLAEPVVVTAPPPPSARPSFAAVGSTAASNEQQQQRLVTVSPPTTTTHLPTPSPPVLPEEKKSEGGGEVKKANHPFAGMQFKTTPSAAFRPPVRKPPTFGGKTQEEGREGGATVQSTVSEKSEERGAAPTAETARKEEEQAGGGHGYGPTEDQPKVDEKSEERGVAPTTETAREEEEQGLPTGQPGEEKRAPTSEAVRKEEEKTGVASEVQQTAAEVGERCATLGESGASERRGETGQVPAAFLDSLLLLALPTPAKEHVDDGDVVVEDSEPTMGGRPEDVNGEETLSAPSSLARSTTDVEQGEGQRNQKLDSDDLLSGEEDRKWMSAGPLPLSRPSSVSAGVVKEQPQAHDATLPALSPATVPEKAGDVVVEESEGVVSDEKKEEMGECPEQTVDQSEERKEEPQPAETSVDVSDVVVEESKPSKVEGGGDDVIDEGSGDTGEDEEEEREDPPTPPSVDYVVDSTQRDSEDLETSIECESPHTWSIYSWHADTADSDEERERRVREKRTRKAAASTVTTSGGNQTDGGDASDEEENPWRSVGHLPLSLFDRMSEEEEKEVKKEDLLVEEVKEKSLEDEKEKEEFVKMEEDKEEASDDEALAELLAADDALRSMLASVEMEEEKEVEKVEEEATEEVVEGGEEEEEEVTEAVRDLVERAAEEANLAAPSPPASPDTVPSLENEDTVSSRVVSDEETISYDQTTDEEEDTVSDTSSGTVVGEGGRRLYGDPDEWDEEDRLRYGIRCRLSTIEEDSQEDDAALCDDNNKDVFDSEEEDEEEEDPEVTSEEREPIDKEVDQGKEEEKEEASGEDVSPIRRWSRISLVDHSVDDEEDDDYRSTARSEYLAWLTREDGAAAVRDAAAGDSPDAKEDIAPLPSTLPATTWGAGIVIVQKSTVVPKENANRLPDEAIATVRRIPRKMPTFGGLKTTVSK